MAVLLVGICAPDSRAVSLYLGDEYGNVSFSVDVDEVFYVALWVTDVTDLAGYQAKVTFSSNVHASAMSAHGDWFSDGHAITEGIAWWTHRSAILSDPTEISGSGDLVVFTFTADEAGVASFNMDADYLLLGNTDAEEIEVDAPSTLYVTINEGKGGGGKRAAGEEETPQESAPAPEEVPDAGTPAGPGEEAGGVTLDGRGTWYVDDDAPYDPGPGDPSVSDPLENGSEAHPYDAIQEGIDAASANDTVMVLDGTYNGNGNWDVDFKGKAITVQSQNGYDNCIVDCHEEGQRHRGFIFQSNEAIDSVLRGFTIKRGLAPAGHGWSFGGGIYCVGASPTIEKNLMTDNSAGRASYYYGYGGAIYCHEASPTISDNVITENRADCGGGIYCWNTSPTITGNEIAGNLADYEDGGGIYCDDGSPGIIGNVITLNDAQKGGGIACMNDASPTIADNVISGNQASEGGGVSASGVDTQPQGTIEGNIIASNRAYYHGGGLFCWRSLSSVSDNEITSNDAVYGGGVEVGECSPVVTGNLIAGNTATEFAGGVDCYNADPTIDSNTIQANTADRYGGGIACLADSALEPLISSNIIAGNTALSCGGGVYCERTSSPTLTNNTLTGNRAVNPWETTYGGAFSCAGNSSPDIENCILWDNVSDNGSQIALEKIGDNCPTLSVTYSDVQGGEADVYVEGGCTLIWGAGNMGEDPSDNPLFADPGQWDDNGTPEDPSDDTWLPGDYHLKSTVGRWDPTANEGAGGWVKDDLDSPCINAGNPESEYSLEPGPHGYRINMAAYGNTDEASKKWRLEGDCNGDCKVNILDLIFVRNKLNQDPEEGDNWKANVNSDHKINILDLIYVRNRINNKCED